MGGGTVSNGVLELSGSLTFGTVVTHFEAWSKQFDSGAVTGVDLGKVGNVDSAGLALLLEWQAVARRNEREIRFTNAPRDLLRLAALSEASELLGLQPVPEFAHVDLV